MKKIILLSILSTMSLFAFSQDYYSLIEENRTWNEISVMSTGSLPNDTTFKTLTYQFFGDTTIDSKTYHKLYYSDEEYPTNWRLSCFMREETAEKKVWQREKNFGVENIVYDFTLLAGDSIFSEVCESYLVIDSISQIEINQTIRNKYWLSCNYYPYYKETWIEGIGSSKGVSFSLSPCIVGGYSIFLCVSNEEELIYRNPNYNTCYLITEINNSDEQNIECFPNPVSHTIYLNNEKSIKINLISLMNVNGQLVKQFDTKQTKLNVSDLETGFYFLKIQHEKGCITNKIIIE